MTTAFRQTLHSLLTDAEIRHIREATAEERDDVCASLQRRIAAVTIGEDLAAEIDRAHALLRDGETQSLAVVRSSATAEDMANASFAGQHRTYYRVEAEGLVDSIRRCWASLWTPEAVVYRASLGIDDRSVAMAVVVQRMIPSNVSGTAFTADPVTGERRQVAIEASWGLGSTVVDGRVTPDQYKVNRLTLEIAASRITDKRYMLSGDRTATGLPIPVPEDLRRAETLGRSQVEAVAALAIRCEERLGCPQDVEWTIAEDQLYLLQSRPITTIRSHEIEPPAGTWVLFKPIVENFADPLTPLQVDLMSRAFSPFIQAIGGRFYVSVKWVRRLLPFRLSDEAVANLLYLTEEGAPVPHFSVLKLPLTLIAGFVAWLALGELLVRSRGMPDDFMDGYRALCRRVEENPNIGPVGALRRLLTIGQITDPVGLMVVSVNCLAAIRTPFWVGTVRALLRRWAPNLGEGAIATLCAGSDGILTVEMAHDLAILADSARREPDISNALATMPPESVLKHLRDLRVASPFLAQIDTFLVRHGHRTAKEFEVQVPRWQEDPSQLVALLRNQIAPYDRARAEARGRADQRREKLEHQLKASLGWRWHAVRFAARRAREFLKLRENSRFYHIMGFGVVRKKILEVEDELLATGKLGSRGDIFYLLWSEIVALRSEVIRFADVEERIQTRRIEHLRRARTPPPRTFGIRLSPRQARPNGVGDTLYGHCASPGKYEGVVRVIRDPGTDASLMPGEVLVAPYADPAWTPLFLIAGAAVVEVGSYLSHSGTIAREYGMPFVVDVERCTERLESGMRILVDADCGEVRIVGTESS